jgi:hypothetical protein
MSVETHFDQFHVCRDTMGGWLKRSPTCGSGWTPSAR